MTHTIEHKNPLLTRIVRFIDVRSVYTMMYIMHTAIHRTETVTESFVAPATAPYSRCGASELRTPANAAITARRRNDISRVEADGVL